jgi:plasmid stabilization system protein ParE
MSTETDAAEYLAALTEILTVFDDDPAMTEDLLTVPEDQRTAEAAALVRIREIGRGVMEGRGTAFSETAEAHIRQAGRYVAAAEELAGATSYEGGLRRTNDLQAAQVHATLAQTLKASELMPMMAELVESIRPARAEVPAAGDETEPAS